MVNKIMAAPLVSVVILTHNRKDILRKSVASILSLNWPNLEVIVVDNLSSDGTADMISSEFGGQAQLIRRVLDSPTAGRNEGFRAAKGDFILSIDNDMVFSDPDVVGRAVALFNRFPDAGVLTFKIAGIDNPTEPVREHWWHPIAYELGKDHFFYTNYFSEGAVFLRTEVLRALGGYDDNYFACFEGVDLALRILQYGSSIIYCPTISCVELQVRKSVRHTRSEWNYFFLRNKLWTAWKHYALCRGILFVAPRIAKDALYSLRYGWADMWFAAVEEGIFAPQAIRAKRRPLPATLWKRNREIAKGRLRLAVGEFGQGSDSSSLRVPSCT